MSSLINIRPCVHDAISLLECVYGNEGEHLQGAGVNTLAEESSVLNLIEATYGSRFYQIAWILWSACVKRKVSTIYLTQQHRTADLVANLICLYGNVEMKNFYQGELTEDEFTKVTWACGKVAGAPLRLGEINSAEEFAAIARALAEEEAGNQVICDWYLSPEEMSVIEVLAQEHEVCFTALK